MTRPKHALVIGSGMAGPVVALALQRAGIHAAIYEGHAEARDAEGSFLGLAPNGRDVLTTLGIRDDIDAVGIETTQIALLNHAGKRLGISPQPVLTVKRGLLTGALRQAAEAHGIPVQYGKRPGRHQRLRARRSGRPFRGRLRGKRRLLDRRRWHPLPHAPHGDARRARADVHRHGQQWWLHPCARRAVVGRDRRGAPAPGELEAIPDDTWRQTLLDLHRPDHAPLGDIISSTRGEIARLGVYEMPVLPTWHTGRVCLVGDAAHATGPHSGQGGSMALEDAIVLAKCLRDIPDVESAFAAFQNIRKARVDHVVRETRRIGDRKAPPGRLGRFTRDLVLPVFLKVGVAMFAPIYSHHIAWDEPVTT
jgi:2-polyprenyl-6-methoxyphenol hydroxylase-like FAD-dependent oxidoreductase